MTRITRALLRSRAEHNEGMLSSLEEVALHQQNLQRIEALGQLCPKLKILYLQNNLIGRIENLHKLKDLEYLNLAMNSVTKVQNLQRCEALAKLDLTINFVPKAGLLSLSSLAGSYNLRELMLMGNPCADWEGYRLLVIGTLPQLQRLDGSGIKHSERIAAAQALPGLLQQLRDELRAEGVDPDQAAQVEDDSEWEEGAEVAETGQLNEAGEMVRPWCPATRILEHREMDRANREAEQNKAAAQKDPFSAPPKALRDEFPPLKDGDAPLQCNEGRWDFTLDESEDGQDLVLEVSVGRYLDTSLIKADVQPRFVRLLIKGRLLQLLLPAEVRPDSSVAQRSNASGRLVLTMPKESPEQRCVDVTHMRPRQAAALAAAAACPGASDQGGGRAAQRQPRSVGVRQPASLGGMKGGSVVGDDLIRAARKAAVTAVSDEDDDSIPAL